MTVARDYLVSLSLLGLPKSCYSYQDYVNRREKLPKWERLCSDLVQEQFRQTTKDGSSSKTDDEENCALDGKAKKRQGKKSQSKSETGKEGKKQDTSKVKCFNYHDHGHYATKFPQNKKNNKKALRAVVGEPLAS